MNGGDSTQQSITTTTASQTIGTDDTQAQSPISEDKQLLDVAGTAINALTKAELALNKVDKSETLIAEQTEEVSRQRKEVKGLANDVLTAKNRVNNVVAAVVIALLAILISAVMFQIQFMQSISAQNEQFRQFVLQMNKK